MKPAEKGWLKDYLEFRRELLKDLSSGVKNAAHPEQSLYRVIQPTGLMYGQSIDTLKHNGTEPWAAKDRMKILLAESLISSSLLFHDKPIKSPDELSEVIMKTLENIGNFYNHVFPELATLQHERPYSGEKKHHSNWRKKFLIKGLRYSIEPGANFWVQFFHNSLLTSLIFLFFGQWIHTNADRIVADFFQIRTRRVAFFGGEGHGDGGSCQHDY